MKGFLRRAVAADLTVVAGLKETDELVRADHNNAALYAPNAEAALQTAKHGAPNTKKPVRPLAQLGTKPHRPKPV